MTGSNGHAPKRFAETRSRTILCVQRVSGALPLTSRGQFSRRRKLPEKQSGYLFALLAGFSVPRIYALSGGISPNEKRGRLHILLLIIRIFQFDGSVNDTFHNGQIFLRAKL